VPSTICECEVRAPTGGQDGNTSRTDDEVENRPWEDGNNKVQCQSDDEDTAWTRNASRDDKRAAPRMISLALARWSEAPGNGFGGLLWTSALEAPSAANPVRACHGRSTSAWVVAVPPGPQAPDTCGGGEHEVLRRLYFRRLVR